MEDSWLATGAPGRVAIKFGQCEKNLAPFVKVNRLCGIVFNRFYRLEIHSFSGVCIFGPACKLLPPWTKELYLCTVAPLLYLFSDLLPPPPLPNAQYMQTVCDCGGGGGAGGMLNCAVDLILLEFYTLFLTRFITYKIATPPQTKMTSKDDIKGFVSLKFLRFWVLPWLVH
jgi:hypothetical protein